MELSEKRKTSESEACYRFGWYFVSIDLLMHGLTHFLFLVCLCFEIHDAVMLSQPKPQISQIKDKNIMEISFL